MLQSDLYVKGNADLIRRDTEIWHISDLTWERPDAKSAGTRLYSPLLYSIHIWKEGEEFPLNNGTPKNPQLT